MLNKLIVNLTNLMLTQHVKTWGQAIIRTSFLGSIFFIFGCASAENTAKSWVGQPIQTLVNVPDSNVKKAYSLENGNSIYVSSDRSQSECKTYWEVNDKGLIVGYRRERRSWKCD